MEDEQEDWFDFLLATLTVLSHPTVANICGPRYPKFSNRKFIRRASSLNRTCLEIVADNPLDARVPLLLRETRSTLLGGRDPLVQWQRPWDGKWVMVVFDIPTHLRKKRVQLRRTLLKLRFGCLQGSVYLSPDLSPEVRPLLTSQAGSKVRSFSLLKCSPAGGETDGQFVSNAWNFGRINKAYDQYVNHVDRSLERLQKNMANPEQCRVAAQDEMIAWELAASTDPLLPERLLPGNYQGKRAWLARVQFYKKLKKWEPVTGSHSAQRIKAPLLE